MHDISVRGRDFGVWKVWAELREQGPSYAFEDGPGLGVWQKPPAETLSEPLASLLHGTERSREFASYYCACARALQERIGQQWRDGTIRDTAAAHQTIIQVFHTRDGIHREEDSVVARIGHEEWKDIVIPLPRDAGAAPLRIDFLSAYTWVDIADLKVSSSAETLFDANDAHGFDAITVAGDAERLPHPHHFRIKITGVDPQLYLPAAPTWRADDQSAVRLRLRVSTTAPRD